ncbi:uncharacterized protein LOC131666305 [Phymastichus coffea]|uniref:uncharacterized protein LOC131666305 n=1 Tax=Phymastichus coffea TaxID=108790 RepID=UPI00273C94F3|nr:uncharacterized protein LOC131666305 [Phymastichus coffea]
MHKTFGLLDRVNVLHWGACRLWLVVQLHFERALEIRLANHLTHRGGYPPWCPMPTYHKEFMVLPSLLRKWSIPFEIIVQRPGDLVHLRDWVPHQIIDLGTNISETVSVGSVEWNMSADNSAFLNCPCGTKPNVGDNNFGGNTTIYGRVELLIPRSKPMPCTNVERAIEAAKNEYNNGVFTHNKHLSTNYNIVPVLKEYRKPKNPIYRTKGGCKCYSCGKRSDDLKAHLNRHILCQARLNLSRVEGSAVEEPITDESDEELLYNKDLNDDSDAFKFRCAYCTKPFDDQIEVIKHVVQSHKQKALQKNVEEPGPIVRKRRKKTCDALGKMEEIVVYNLKDYRTIT